MTCLLVTKPPTMHCQVGPYFLSIESLTTFATFYLANFNVAKGNTVLVHSDVALNCPVYQLSNFLVGFSRQVATLFIQPLESKGLSCLRRSFLSLPF